MKKQASLFLCLLLTSLSTPLPTAGQLPEPSSTTATTTTTASPQSPSAPAQTTTPPAVASEQEDVVRITTNLVQVDVVVLDKDGRQVTDLRAEDFEIEEDGKPREITNFSYVSNETGTRAPQTLLVKKEKNAPPAPPVRLRPEQVRRTIALAVDDLGLTFESTYFVRRALKKFVDEQMQPNDLVAIIRTGGGMGALQQFTSDKRILYAAIERVRWNPLGRGGIGTFAPIENFPQAPVDRLNSNPGNRRDDERSLRDLTGIRDVDEFREDIFSVGTLGALNFIVRGLKELPGRKSVILFSDGFEIARSDDGDFNARVRESLQRLVDLANRASVVFYAVDPRGLPYIGITAADNTAGLSPQQLAAVAADRSFQMFSSQGGMEYLSRETGGFLIKNNNDLSGGVERVLDDQKGFYLIGYRPDESTFDPVRGRGKFHKVTARVKRPGLRVRTRSGFYGFTESEAKPIRRTRLEQIGAALSSPFASGGIQLRLTSIFGSEDAKNALMGSMLHMDTRALTFTDEPDGWKKTVFDVVALTFGDNGTVIDEKNVTQTLRMRGKRYDLALRDGLVFNLRVPVKKPGAYQLRIAVRDVASERVGSVSQFIEVPRLSKDRVTLSGIVLMSSEHSAARMAAINNARATANAPAGDDDEAREAALDALSGPALRTFRRGAIVDYTFDIFNAKLGADGKPQLLTQTRLFRDGQEIFAGRQMPFDASGQADLKRLQAGARMQLGANMPPGEYILQVIVTDTLAKEKRRAASQWIDFEVVP